MFFRTQVPSAPISHYVEMLWFFAGPGPAHRRERVLPDGTAELVINLDDVARKRFDRHNPRRFQTVRRSWISGPQPEFILIDVLPQATMIGVHFKPGGLAAFLPHPVGELGGQLIELDALWGSEAEDLRDAMLETPAVEPKFRLLETFLHRRIRASLQSRSQMEAAVRLLTLEPEMTRIDELAARLGMSHKHFVHRFRSEVGLTPKRFSRIRRFHRVLNHLQTGQGVDWTDLACANGYYDQAHFIHDFRAFSGLTPTVYAGQPGADARFVPIDD